MLAVGLLMSIHRHPTIEDSRGLQQLESAPCCLFLSYLCQRPSFFVGLPYVQGIYGEFMCDRNAVVTRCNACSHVAQEYIEHLSPCRVLSHSNYMPICHRAKGWPLRPTTRLPCVEVAAVTR